VPARAHEATIETRVLARADRPVQGRFALGPDEFETRVLARADRPDAIMRRTA
jgi:hypothetical protein